MESRITEVDIKIAIGNDPTVELKVEIENSYIMLASVCIKTVRILKKWSLSKSSEEVHHDVNCQQITVVETESNER